MQEANLGHRAREDDPLYRIRSRVLTATSGSLGGDERGCWLGWPLGPGGEVAAAWRGKELLGSSTERSARQRPAALGGFCQWCDAMASRSLSRPGWLVPQQATLSRRWGAPPQWQLPVPASRMEPPCAGRKRQL